MKVCPNCTASNPDTARFCNDCGAALSSMDPPRADARPVEPAAAVGGVDASMLKKSIASLGESLQGRRKADVMFVLDCTGSMEGEIDAIKDAITAFADTIESDGVRVRVGLVEFRDRFEGEEHHVLSFSGEPFTKDPAAFRLAVAPLKATGGGDTPESSLVLQRRDLTSDGLAL